MADYENSARLLVVLVKCAITGESPPSGIDYENYFSEIMRLGAYHQVAHLAAYTLISRDLLKDAEHIKSAQKYIREASYRDTKNKYTLQTAKDILEANGIPYMALKGALVKNYYPESWMRSSCDIDILVKKQDFSRAAALLEGNGFKRDSNLNFHDISLLYDDTNLELHFSICENIKSIDSMLKNVWDYARKTEGCEYAEDRDFFVFHHIAHMSYHFLAGGCGIRPFLDYWILRRANFFDFEKVKELCEKAQLADFYAAVVRLVDVWFEGAEYNEVTYRMKEYIVTGGAYGYYPNNAAAETIRNGGKRRQVFAIAFPPYRNMRVLYPVLNRAPVLLPFCYVYRVFQKTIGKNSRNAKKKYRIIKGQDNEFIKEVATLMKLLDLDTKKGGN